MSNETQSDRVFGAVRAEILGCRLLPGSKLRINEIAEQSDVSLGAVREALSRLGAEGLVVAESQKGFRVAPLSADDFRDLTDARVEIEKLTLARSIARGDLEWESQLVAAWHRLSRTPEQLNDNRRLYSDEWSAAHREFHRALVAACGSEKLLNIRAQLYEQAERYRRCSGVVSEKERDVAAEHKRLFDATIARDAAAAIREMGEHLSLTADIIIGSATLDSHAPETMVSAADPAGRKRSHVPSELTHVQTSPVWPTRRASE
jgi:DNA-binding GntR family transcriptional regulator